MFFWEVSQSFHYNYFFEMLIDECSKTSNNLFSTTPMVASGWMKRRSQITESLREKCPNTGQK